MEKKSRMSARPPVPQTAQEFIAGAEQTKALTQTEIDEKLPWLAPGVRDDVIKSVNFRLPEAYILKLQYVSEKTHKSQQQLLREALFPALDAEIERILTQFT